MKVLKKHIAFIIWIIAVGSHQLVFSQSRLESFEMYSMESLTGLYANPVSTQDDRSRGGVIYRSYLGDFSDVRVFSAYGSLKVGEESAGSNIGMMYYSDQNGPFISKNRFYMHYVNHIRLNNDTKLSLGTLTGAVNVQLGGAGANVSAGGWLFSTNIGALLSKPNWNVGASIQQVFDQELRPIQGAVKYPLSYNLNGDWSKDFNADYQLSIASHIRLIPSSEISIAFNPILYYHKAIFGTQLLYQKFIGTNDIPSIALMTGIQNYCFNDYCFDLLLSYNFGLPTESIPQQNQLELLLQAYF